MTTHSSTLAWKTLWTEEPTGLQSMELQRVGHNWATWLQFMFLETCLFPLGCSIWWHIIVPSSGFEYFCSMLFFSSLIYCFAYLGPHSFLLGKTGQKKFGNIVYPFKKSALGFIDFFLFFKILCIIYFLPDLYNFISSDNFRFVFSFFFFF